MRGVSRCSGVFCLGALLVLTGAGRAEEPVATPVADEATRAKLQKHKDKINRMPPVATAAGLAGIYYVLDCTNEGYIGIGEASEHGGTLFRRMDLDRSHKLSRSEYLAFVHESVAHIRNAYFDEMDLDGDDLVNHIDYLRHLERLILAADIDQNGETTWTEILTLRGEIADEAEPGQAAPTPGIANFQTIDVKAASPQKN